MLTARDECLYGDVEMALSLNGNDDVALIEEARLPGGQGNRWTYEKGFRKPAGSAGECAATDG